MYLQLGQMPAPNGTAAPQSGQFGQGVSGVERSLAVPASQTGAAVRTRLATGVTGTTGAGKRKHASRNARASSPADANRWLGSLTSARATTSATDFGRSGRASNSEGA